MARQQVNEQRTPNHAASQAVVAFPDAAGAKSSYADQVKTVEPLFKPDRQRTPGRSPEGPDRRHGCGRRGDGVATLPITPDIGLPGLLSERALIVAGNVVVVDVPTCGPDGSDTAGAFARDIAAKINSGRGPTADPESAANYERR